MKKILLVMLALILAVSFAGCAKTDVKTADELVVQATKYDSYANQDRIMSALDAKDLIDANDNLIVIDIRKSPEYMLGHIPMAQNIWRPDYSASEGEYEYGGMRSDTEKLVELMGSLGANRDTMILLYDAKGDYDGARLMWQLEMINHENMALIDGGLHGWKAAGLDTVTESTDVTATTYEFDGELNTAKLATLEDIKVAINDPNVIIIDTRSIGESTGEDLKKGAFRKGRIPTSVWIEYKNNINTGDGADMTFKTVEELTAMYEAKGITPDKTVITYCQSGVRSAHTTFVLSHLLGFENVLNYDGSWIEYSYNEDLELETGEIQ